MLLAQAMKFRGELGRSFRRRTERIEWNGHVAIAANGVDQLSRGGDFAKKGGIELSRQRSFALRSRWLWRTTQTLGKSEKLAPRLVNRRRIASIGFVRLAYVSVVEDARDRVGRAHNPKFNCALLSPAHRRESRACTWTDPRLLAGS